MADSSPPPLRMSAPIHDNTDNTAAAIRSILSVSELNRLAREILESRLPLQWIAGEISNLTLAASGHAYFTLKDSGAQVRCVMFRSRAQLLGWRPENGQRVEARALVTLYEARGDFQLNVEAMRLAGAGRLYEEFARLKIRLEREGLFDPAVKRALPTFPRRIGVVSSPQAAALRDVVTTLTRRAPYARLILYPTAVQGNGAATEIVAALQRAGVRHECDVLILCRGGGSIEDLWSFNEEAVARAIRASPLPVITGIGHETDFTIADFAADLRAPTPSAAAEQAAPDRADLETALDALGKRLTRATRRKLEIEQQRIDFLGRNVQHPAAGLARRRVDTGHLAARLESIRRHLTTPYRNSLASLGDRLVRQRPDLAARRTALATHAVALTRAVRGDLERKNAHLASLAAQLRQLDPAAVLGRGYSIATREDGEILRDASIVEPGARIVVNLWRGRLHAGVNAVETGSRPDDGNGDA